MKIFLRIALLGLCPTLGVGQPALTLHYHKPASEWTEALPIGNGRLGAMIFGGVKSNSTTQYNRDLELRGGLASATFSVDGVRLQEWYRDFDDVDPHHRHTSHLFALYPANEISPLATPELAAAAKRTLELRGDHATGWSLAWRVSLWARLLDGNRAYALFRNLLRLTREGGIRYDGNGGGAYPNLFDGHPPFQIDGNFASTAGVIELLLQSQNQELHLLPTLPDAWAAGSVKGLVGRGGFVVDMDWTDHRLKSAVIVARNAGDCVVRTSEPVTLLPLKLRSEKSSIGYTLRFQTVRDGRYVIQR